MSANKWFYEFNNILLSSLADRDDDLFLQISIVERYLKTYGKIPGDQKIFHRLSKAVEFYQEEIVPAIGEFPAEGAKYAPHGGHLGFAT